jgi:hydrogenase nickel incorporation protein HypA/HybF
MHELPIVRSLLSIALRRAAEARAARILALDVRIGALCDGEERWMERYFRLAARGTIAEGAALRVERERAEAVCAACGRRFEPELRRRKRIRCPDCGADDCALEGGSEYTLERMEVR